jgi:hypothetical protein
MRQLGPAAADGREERTISDNANDLLAYLANSPESRADLEKQPSPEAKRKWIADAGYKVTRSEVEALQREAARRFLEAPADEFDADDSTLLTTVLAAFWNDSAFWCPAFWAEAFWTPTGFRTAPAPPPGRTGAGA